MSSKEGSNASAAVIDSGCVMSRKVNVLNSLEEIERPQSCRGGVLRIRIRENPSPCGDVLSG